MTSSATARESTATRDVIEQLAKLLGPEHVLLDRTEREFFGQDAYSVGCPPLAVVRPGNVEQVADVARIARAAGIALLPRGGGLSYTGGYVTEHPESITVDLSRLDRVVEINVEDRYVTVECGTTWKQLYEALEPLGVRTPFWGTLSGIRATIGGGLSQGAIFLGSGVHGAAAESVLGMDVVLADGTIARVGAHANGRGEPFFRQFGPDLSALFTGDCGALGIKVRATLRLIALPTDVRYLSFGFPDAVSLLDSLADVARAGLASEVAAFDPGMQKIRMKRQSLKNDVKALGGVMKAAGGGMAALKAGARIVLAGRSFLDDVQFSMHMSLEGRDAADADSKAAAVRRLIGARGQEVEATIPRVLRSNPFAEVNSMLGPGGERWVPVHGVVPFSKAAATFAALEGVFSSHAAEREQYGIDHGYLICNVGDRGIVLEPVFYWPDKRSLFHERVLDPSYLATLPEHPENLAARAAVHRIRAEIAECLVQHGAVNFQVGRFYLFQEGLDPTAASLLKAFKRVLDPLGIVNPGALGLDAR